MLKSLRSIAKDDRAAVLASSIRLLTESPFDDVRLRDRRWNEVIIDAAEKAGASLSNATDRDFMNVRSVLANELRKVILPPGSVAKVRERVGQKGLFHPSVYTLSFSKEFREHKESFRVSEAEVQRAVKRPDRFDHLKIDGTNESSLTLVAQRKHMPCPHWILAVFRRVGAELQCVTAWKVPCSIVSYIPTKESLDLLRGFVDVFGATFKVGGAEGKLFVYETMSQPARVEVSQSENVNVCFFARPLIGGKIEVALAYAILSDPYIEILAKEGLINTGV